MAQIDAALLSIRGGPAALLLRDIAGSTRATIAASDKAPLVAACTTALVLPIASSFAFQLANLRLYDLGASAWIIGVSAGIQALGIAIAAPFTPVIMRILGGRATILLGLLCAVAASLMMSENGDAFGWASGRALLAVGIAFIYTVGEALILRRAQLRTGARGIGLYSGLLAAGAGLGPLFVAMVGTTGSLPVLLSAGLFMAAALPLVLYLSSDVPAIQTGRCSTLRSLRRIWLALAAVFVFGFLEAGAIGMLALHGSLQGYSIGVAVSATAVAAAGAIVFQYPIARLAARLSTQKMLGIIAIGSLVCVLLFPASSGHPIALLTAAFTFGGLLDGLYTVSLVIFAQYANPAERTGGNACLVGFCSLGEFVGPVATGAGMFFWGPDALPQLVAIVLLGFLFVILALDLHRRFYPGGTHEATRCL